MIAILIATSGWKEIGWSIFLLFPLMIDDRLRSLFFAIVPSSVTLGTSTGAAATFSLLAITSSRQDGTYDIMLQQLMRVSPSTWQHELRHDLQSFKRMARLCNGGPKKPPRAESVSSQLMAFQAGLFQNIFCSVLVFLPFSPPRAQRTWRTADGKGLWHMLAKWKWNSTARPTPRWRLTNDACHCIIS